MADIVYIPDHRAIAQSRLLAQFRDKPRMASLVRAMAAGAQAVEDDGFGILVSTTLPLATNNDLDHWGALVGERRGTLDDATYRIFISARILVNKARGTRDELIRILQLITAPSEVTHTDLFPACFQFVILRQAYMSNEHYFRVGETMRAVKPGGVCMLITEAVPGYFGFVPDPNAQPLDVGPFSRLVV